MSIHAKILVDVAEFDRLKAIEKAYKEWKEEKSVEKHKLHGKGEQSGGNTECTCSTLHEKTSPPLSEIVALNEKAQAISPPERGVLGNITDPSIASTAGESTYSACENFNVNEWKNLPEDNNDWYFLERK